MFSKLNKAFMVGAALTALLAGGCNSASNTRVSSLREPDPAAALVLNEPGLGAADALGHVVFVEDGYRYAQANGVFQMAAAEDKNLKLSGITYQAPVHEALDQRIVSADQLRREMIAAGEIPPTPAAPVTTFTGVETQD